MFTFDFTSKAVYNNQSIAVGKLYHICSSFIAQHAAQNPANYLL